LEPDILLLDEPFSALDYQTRLEVADDIWGIIRKEKKTAILITHDISEAISMSDRVIILTKRPGSVKRIIDIKLSITDPTPFRARSAPEFTDYFNLIWKELNNLEQKE
jgi:NitT/TauT family transport system ATP-binding protein